MDAPFPSLLTRDRRRPAAVVATVLTVLLAATVVGAWGAGRADATSYRFWTYWSGGADWTFASQGAARRPADGAVEGWRFAVSPATTSTIPPRHSPSFESLCGGTSAPTGKKRVGLVVDFGTTADAPAGESPAATITSCAVVPSDATGYDVLMTVATLRTDQGLICGIDGYPARECGVVVSDPTPSPSASGGGSSGYSGGSTAGGGQDRQSDGSAAGGSVSSTSGPKDASDGGATGQDDDRDSSRAEDRPGDRDGTSSPRPESAGTTAVAAESTTTTAGSGSGSPVGVLVGVGLVAALAAAAVVLRRRRS